MDRLIKTVQNSLVSSAVMQTPASVPAVEKLTMISRQERAITRIKGSVYSELS